ncbi:DUF4166 domain-containing protein [Dyella choica]|uniref:DUF4166 domain-containing protein n=1 Tax=Dyella choica TaxID=1927959 RepID=A0A3S0RJG9_9GAMM|nr:DUF4166 domain-containing protein [Dyella choica]RUL73656.1 DUF4166 domain-containing protein [Dyella choica]
MNTGEGLFPSLLGQTAWRSLPEPVRRLHGADARVIARGLADVEGDNNLVLRALRRLLGLPHPAPEQALEVCIERSGSSETWKRRFALGRMQSTLRNDATASHLLERLGPITLRFKLVPDAHGVTWHLNGAWMLGVRVPRLWLGTVLSHSGEHDGRYAFRIDTRLPWIGRLVAYRGWLEIVTDD